ncbi:hypothetical protein AXJ18_gp092 [Streptomyces phage Jay2Jay]|uniref:Uncharacterized protein n=1 Tax=Streptomyces phage Jay2Jay TaxID=1556290 RepID=A0A0A0RQQ2_9CAUD|nr:hypothetical protein AXJ18_gp092 [Streptomyces phage Jay2Jay]AIW02682.1 hypothetical protein PBI_JAY2JAY_228 [Streptomyces phage Jay2Jay]
MSGKTWHYVVVFPLLSSLRLMSRTRFLPGT